MVAKMPELKNFRNQAQGGETITSIRKAIQQGRLKVGGFHIVVVHVGTNDVARSSDTSKILLEYKRLVDEIQRFNRSATLILSTILPRWVDDQITALVISSVNKSVLRKADTAWNCLVVRSDKLFRWGGDVRAEFYARDRLHLNARGTIRLGDFLATQTSKSQVEANIQCRERRKCVR